MRMFRCRLVAKRNDVLGMSGVTVFFRFQVRRRRADAMSAVCVCAIEWGPNRTTYPDDTSTDVVIRPRGEREREIKFPPRSGAHQSGVGAYIG